MRRKLLLLTALLLAAGCTSDGTGPGRLVVGQWGGPNVTLSATPQQVTLAMVCGTTALFKSAILPDAAGDFTLRNGKLASDGSTLFVAGSLAAPVTLAARGHLSGDQMTLVVTSTTAQGSYDATYQLGRGQPAVTSVYCALD